MFSYTLTPHVFTFQASRATDENPGENGTDKLRDDVAAHDGERDRLVQPKHHRNGGVEMSTGHSAAPYHHGREHHSNESWRKNNLIFHHCKNRRKKNERASGLNAVFERTLDKARIQWNHCAGAKIE